MDQREGKYFAKEASIPFRGLAEDYEKAVDTTGLGRLGDDRSRIARWISVFRDQDTRSISPDQIERTLNTLLTEGKKPATVHRYFTVLKAILNRKTVLKLVRD